jgi:hypothetical protein
VAAVASAVVSAPLPRKLRVGLFADAPLQPRWIVEAFEQVARSDFAEIVLISSGETAPRQPLLWQLYRRADRWAFGEDLSEPLELAALGKSGSDPDLSKRDLDVAFVLGDLDEAPLYGVARYGVWRFCFGNERGHAESLAGWREVAEGTPLTGSGITVRLAKGSPPRLAYQSWSRTYPLSVARNRAQLLRKTSEFAYRALRDLHRAAGGWLEQCRVVREDEKKVHPELTNSQLVKTAGSIGRRIVQRGVEKALAVDQWFLAWRFREERFGDGRAVPADLKGYTRVMPPKDRDWADPFAIEKNGRYFVFFEELPYAKGKAHISMVEVKRDGSHSAPVKVLERDYHLSYPFLIEEGGELYMIPESGRNASVEIYRCVDFPLRWKHEKTLVEGVRLVDATFHRAPDRWWMFANSASSGSRVFDDELHLFHAEQLLGPWQAHRRNPVKSDARCSRPAGRLFWRNGGLYRPAQICVPLYGAGLSINRVQRLTVDDYTERQVERVLPANGLLGVHTLNRAGDLTVIDAFARRSRFA